MRPYGKVFSGPRPCPRWLKGKEAAERAEGVANGMGFRVSSQEQIQLP
jgi:hypothetical protein